MVNRVYACLIPCRVMPAICTARLVTCPIATICGTDVQYTYPSHDACITQVIASARPSLEGPRFFCIVKPVIGCGRGDPNAGLLLRNLS